MPGQTAFPPEQLRLALTDARNDGLSWRTAWTLGRRAALMGVRTHERKQWIVALNGTAKAWEVAYKREPFPGPVWPLERPTDD